MVTSQAAVPRPIGKRYDFLDLGCSEWGSIAYCQNRFNARLGLGLDIDPLKLEKARQQGYEIICQPIEQCDFPAKSFRFISMLDFLEHLPSFAVVEILLQKAARWAFDFLFIRTPSFEDVDYLRALKLKQYWIDWSGHPTHIFLDRLLSVFQRLGLEQYYLSFQKPALTSDDPCILPLSAPRNQHEYDPKAHGPKPFISFPRPIYGQIDVFVALRSFEQQEWHKIVHTRGRENEVTYGC